MMLGVVGTLSALLHYYLWARLVRDALLPQPWARVATIAIVALGALLPIAMPLTRLLPRTTTWPFSALVYTWMGVLFLAFLLVVVGDVVRLGVAASALLRPDVVASPERRTLLRQSIAAIAAIGAVSIGAFGIYEARAAIRIAKVRVALKRLPKSMAGLTFAQLSDVHVGNTIGHDFLADLVRRTNALSPDVIVITGDLVDGSVKELSAHVAPLADLKAPLGVYFVTGNHEYYSGADEWIAELQRLGIRVLHNERVELRRGDDAIDLAGIDDWSAAQFGGGHGPDLASALEGRDSTRELILLAHQPRAIEEAAERGVGLQLSGHTHGGQIWPWNYLVLLQQPYVAGLHRHRDAQIYVSRGTGYWGPPMRVGAPAEITQITLEQEA